MKAYLKGGFAGLCRPISRPKPKRLADAQEAAFKQVLLDRRPCEMGLEGNIWTGDLMCPLALGVPAGFLLVKVYDRNAAVAGL